MAKIEIDINTKLMNKEEIKFTLEKVINHIDSKSYNFGDKDGDLKFSISKDGNNLLPTIWTKTNS